MIIYGHTYENIKRKNKNFPVEDAYFAQNNIAVVADGITRDPVVQLNQITEEEFIKRYPRPSGATIAAQTVCSTYKSALQTQQSLQNIMIDANENIKKLNDKYIKNCDYVTNDYFGSVAASIRIVDSVLEYCYICDCGVIVFSNTGYISFQTEDEKENINPYIDTKGYTWDQPEARVIVRKSYRNNIKQVKDNKIVSYGALTGELEALHFIRAGAIDLEEGDTILVYSDGFKEYFKRSDFYEQLINFDKQKFENYVETVAATDIEKYGQEKTVLIIKA